MPLPGEDFERGTLGQWGLIGEFTSEAPFTDLDDERYQDEAAGNPAAFVRIYIGVSEQHPSGWITIYSPPEDEEDVEALVDYYRERYE